MGISFFFRSVIVIFLVAAVAFAVTGCSQSQSPSTAATPAANAAADKPLPPAVAGALNKSNSSKAGEDWVRQHVGK